MSPLIVSLLLACGHVPPSETQAPPTATPTHRPTALPPLPPAPEDRPTEAPAVRTPGEKTPSPCEGLTGIMARAATGDTSGLDLDEDGKLQVVVEGTPDVALPAVFTEEKRAMGMIQGRVLPVDLCAIAQAEGVSRVRLPRTVSPK